MTFNVDLPNISQGGNPNQRLDQMQSYIYQLAGQLNYALNILGQQGEAQPQVQETAPQPVAPAGAATLSKLKDVSITNPIDGQALLYNATTHKFENADGASGSDPEYDYSYWREHREEIEATGKRFIVTNAPPSPDLTAENIGYDNTQSSLTAIDVQGAIDEISTVIDRSADVQYLLPGTPQTLKL